MVAIMLVGLSFSWMITIVNYLGLNLVAVAFVFVISYSFEQANSINDYHHLYCRHV